MRVRYRTTSTLTAGLKGKYLPGLPGVEVLDAGHLWVSAVVTGKEELERIVGRLLPGATIEDVEISQTFAEKLMACWS
jgi:hypothetical protein